MNLHRRQFVLASAAVAIVRPVNAAPFVPARDPQVVAFAPGGTMVATGCSGMSDGRFPPRPHPDVRKCGVIAVWDVATRRRLFRWETFGDLTQLAFSPDGTLLASGSNDRTVRLWSVSSLTERQVLEAHSEVVLSVAFSPDGTLLATGSADDTICLWRVADGVLLNTLRPYSGDVTSVAFSPDGSVLVAATEGTIRLWHTADGV